MAAPGDDLAPKTAKKIRQAAPLKPFAPTPASAATLAVPLVYPANGQVAFHEGSMPVFKIGYDKFLSFFTGNGNSLSILMSERKGPSNMPTGRQVTLTLAQFLKLHGLVLSGVMRRDDNTMHALGDGVFFQWSHFAGREVATVRRFVTLQNGNLVPLKKDGLSFGLSTYDTLTKMFQEMTLLKEAVKYNVVKDSPLLGLEYNKSKDALGYFMHHSVLSHRIAKCPSCTAVSVTAPDSRYTKDHVNCTAELHKLVTEEEMATAELDVRTARNMESFLLMHEQANAKQVLDVADYKLVEFIGNNREFLIENVNGRLKKA